MLLLLRWSDLHYTSTSINNRLIGWLILEMPVFAVCVSSEFLTYRCGRPFWSFHQFCSKSSRFGVFFYSSSWIPKLLRLLYEYILAIWIYTSIIYIYNINYIVIKFVALNCLIEAYDCCACWFAIICDVLARAQRCADGVCWTKASNFGQCSK